MGLSPTFEPLPQPTAVTKRAAMNRIGMGPEYTRLIGVIEPPRCELPAATILGRTPCQRRPACGRPAVLRARAFQSEVVHGRNGEFARRECIAQNRRP